VTPSPWSFSWEPAFLALSFVAVVAYARAARAHHPSRVRVTVFGLGVALVIAALCSPLETIARHYLLLFHLLGNVMIADWAPPLLVLGLTPSMRAGIGRRVRVVLHPWLPLATWLAVWYLVHLPAFYDYALRNVWALNVEHALLIAAGLVFWWPVFARALSTPATLAYLGVAFIGSMFLGLAFTFSSSVFYAFYANAPRLWGISPAKDQNLGGILMNVEQTLVFLAALAYFLIRLLDEEQAEQGGDEQKWGAAARPTSPSSDRSR
jgi:cytochrome c oxidase assembly factor CtaG